MAPLNSTRVAWSIAIASLALWATSAPATWGQMVASAEHVLQTTTDDATTTTTTNTSTSVGPSLADFATTTNDTTTADTGTAASDPVATTSQADAQAQTCPTPSSAIAPTAPAAPAASSGSQSGTFHLCGADAQAARSIEQLIAGRPFSATLSAHGDGCADLAIRVTSANLNTGTATSNLSVSLGGGQNLSIQIVSESGTTHVNIGQGR